MRSAFFPAQQQGHGEAASPGDHVHSSKRATVTHTNSPSREHVAPGSISRTTVSCASRTLRFPSSRRYLWDRTAAGPQVLVDLLDYLPHVQIAASTFGAVSRAASSKSSGLTLQLDLSVSDTNQVAALIQEHDPLSVHSSLQLSCVLTQPGAVPADAVSSLRAAVQAHLDQRDIARVEQLYALSASASAAGSPAEPTSLRLQLLMPRVGLLATPLYTKRLCHVPLAETLLKPGCMAAGQTGYLSMDQARSLLPMEATDTNVYSTPLVGVWVKGPAGVLHPLVAAACWRFAYSSLLMDRAVNPEDGAFLLLLCPEGDPVSKCYEVHMTDNSKLELCSYRLVAGVRPAGGLSQYPGGLVSATWVPEQRQIQALPGTLTAAAAGAALSAVAGAARHVQLTSTAGAAGRSVGLLLGSSAHGPAAAADSPVVQRYSQLSRVAELPLGRSSAPSATFGYSAAGSLHNNGAGAAAAAAARRSLPLTYGGDGHSSSIGAPATAEGPWLGPSSTAGPPPGWPEEPQPRAGVPAVPYMPGSQAHTNRQHWRQQQQQQPDSKTYWGHHHQQQQQQLRVSPGHYIAEAAPAHAAVTEPSQPGAGSGGPGFSSTCSSPTKAYRQQQLTWSDRQDQVLRSSLEGAAEALRSSQASLAAAREAASGAGSRLGSPTKGRSTAGEAPASAMAAQPDYGAYEPVGAADTAAGTARQQQHSPGGAADASASPQPALSRLGGQQQHAVVDAESDCGPRMGSPVRASVQKKASMLAAAAAHAAGVPATEGPVQRPVSPAVQAGVALSNLSLLQHLSSGQLQQALQHSPSPRSQQQLQQQQQLCLQGDPVLETVGHAAVAASAGHPAGERSHYEHQREAADMVRQQRQQTGQLAEAHMLHAASHASAASAGAAVKDSMQASHAAAAAIQAASNSMQRSPVHPYSHSLGVQRYAADVAAMQHSSQASPGAHGLLSPGSSPGMVDSSARWQPLQLPYMQQQQQQQQGLSSSMRGLPAAWSPSPAAAAATGGGGGVLGNSSSMGSPYWQQQQQQCQVLQQVSPVSAGLSPGYAAADPVTAALQGEVDRLRQQLQQLQYQLRLAGMTLRGPDLDAAATSTPAPLAAAAAGAGAGQHAQLTAVMQAPSPHLMQQQQQHIEGTPQAGPAPLVASSEVAALEAGPVAQQGEPQQLLGSGGAEQAWLRGQQYPAVSYTQQGAGAPAAAGSGPSTAAAADAGALHSQQPAAGHHPAGGSALLAGVTLHAAVGGKAHPNSRYSSADVSPVQQVVANAATDGAAATTAAAAAVAHPVQQQQQQQGSQKGSAVGNDGAAAAAAGSRPADADCTQEQQQQQHKQAVTEQQLAAANAAAAARQRRRKLDFSAGGCSANADNADSSNSSEAGVAPVESDTADSSAAAAAASPPAKAAATAKEASGAGQDQPAALPAPAAHMPSSPSHEAAVNPCCDSPAAVCTRPAYHADAGVSPLQAASATAARGRGSGGASNLNSSVAGVRHSIRSSVGGGLGHLRASLDAPALVEVVRTRVVELSDDSDEDEWEDRLLLKYGLK